MAPGADFGREEAKAISAKDFHRGMQGCGDIGAPEKVGSSVDKVCAEGSVLGGVVLAEVRNTLDTALHWAETGMANGFSTDRVSLVGKFKEGKSGAVQEVHRDDIGIVAMGTHHQLDVLEAEQFGLSGRGSMFTRTH
jgi:hypothetical protein